MQVYLVGGAVRDKLLGLPIVDKDFVVVGATADELKSLGFIQVGADFPVFLHPKTRFEYALARTERKNGAGYRGFLTHTKNVSLKEDLLRRDLTINALAIQVKGLFDDTPITQEVIDFYGGTTDLQNKVLRHISAAFAEDPLRILRTVRFLAKYESDGFVLADETKQLMQQMAQNNELAHLSKERLWSESVKAMQAAVGDKYWRQLQQLQILPYFLPKLSQLWQNKSVFVHTLACLYEARQYSVAVQFALLCSGALRVHADDNLIADIAQKLHAPKYSVRLAYLLMEFVDFGIQKPDAQKIVQLITKTKAYAKSQQELWDFLDVLYIFHHKKTLWVNQKTAQNILQECIVIYKSINGSMIDKNIQGAQIGIAIHQLRIGAIQQFLQEYIVDTK